MKRLVVLAAAIAVALVLNAPVAHAARANHCINPAGADLNTVYATNDAFATPFCGDGYAGSWVRPLLRWVGAPPSEAVFPAGYEPIGGSVQSDFVAKLASARYVVDAGTTRERTFTFRADQLLIATGTLGDGSQFVAFTPRLQPLPPGAHTIDSYPTMSAESWDGYSLDPMSYLPAGEEHINAVAFTVQR